MSVSMSVSMMQFHQSCIRPALCLSLSASRYASLSLWISLSTRSLPLSLSLPLSTLCLSAFVCMSAPPLSISLYYLVTFV